MKHCEHPECGCDQARTELCAKRAWLRDFENRVAAAFEAREIRGPIHLSGGNEEQLIGLFSERIRPGDWVLSTWRSHYHALLHGVPEAEVMAEIMAGRSMMLNFPAHRFATSAIMGGMLPLACGLAAAGARVWCFVGDMAASTGAFADAQRYARGHALPVTFVVEDNGVSVNTPTLETWGAHEADNVLRYTYARAFPHTGCGKHVVF